MEVNLAGAWVEYIFYFPERKYKFLNLDEILFLGYRNINRLA